MPILLVEKDILDQNIDCVVCPTKSSKVFEFDGIDGLVYEKAGKENLWKAYDKVNPYEITIPVITSGFDLCNNIIHIIGPDLIYCKDFKKDIYNSYHLVMELIIKHNFKHVVFPPIPYGYKRLGNKNSYKTGITLIKYFYNLYAMDCNIYVLVDKQTINDHLNNYESQYVSTSYPLSKRHKPIIYPLTNYDEAKEYVISNSLVSFDNLLKERKIDFNDIKQNLVYEMIKEKYDKDDISFCINANINLNDYHNIMSKPESLSKEKLIAIAISLKLSLIKTNELLTYYNKKNLDKTNKFENIIIECLTNQIYDIVRINEILFINNCKQIGNNG